MKDNAVTKAASEAAEIVVEKSSWFTPKRMIIAAVAAVAVVGTAVLIKKVAGAVEENEEYLEEVEVAPKKAVKSAA